MDEKSFGAWLLEAPAASLALAKGSGISNKWELLISPAKHSLV